MRTLARLIWRLQCTSIMAVWPGWGWIDAWQYSAVLREFAEDKDFFETTPPPRTAICEDMQHWDG